VHHLIAFCHNDACRHTALIDVSKYPDNVEVPRFQKRIKCGTNGEFRDDAACILLPTLSFWFQYRDCLGAMWSLRAKEVCNNQLHLSRRGLPANLGVVLGAPVLQVPHGRETGNRLELLLRDSFTDGHQIDQIGFILIAKIGQTVRVEVPVETFGRCCVERATAPFMLNRYDFLAC
jgi:hypothetical protein